MKKFLAGIAAFLVFGCLLTFIMAINDWGQSAPPELVQLFWAISLIALPVFTYDAIMNRRS